MSIRDMEMLGIGKPNDVGGTETEGTVMAKENAILEMLNGYKSKVKGNMILKRTPTQTITVSSTGSWSGSTFVFEFDKPVKIVGIYFQYTKSSTSAYNTNFPVYIINGEDSFTAYFRTPKASTLGIFCRTNGSDVAFSGLYADVEPVVVDIWATKLQIHPSAPIATDSAMSSYVLYQEEG